jgi:hypothetical protein
VTRVRRIGNAAEGRDGDLPLPRDGKFADSPLEGWREMDSNLWYGGTKARDFWCIPGIVSVSNAGDGDLAKSRRSR